MKHDRILLYLLSVLLIFVLSAPVSAQEALKPKKLSVKWEMTDCGDARVEASSTLDAAGWDNYKKTIGNNPDILKRQMERTFPGFYLQNFSYKDDPMNRSWSLSFDVLGLSKLNSKGLWTIDLHSKDPDVTKLSDHNYVITSNFSGGGALLQEIDYVNFPQKASEIKQGKDTFGKAIFTYSLTPGGNINQWITLGAGSTLIFIGLLLLGINVVRSGKKE